MCPINPNYLYAAMVVAAIFFSCYLGSKDQPNPYENRTVWKDAKAGNFWAKVCVGYSVVFGALLLAFFACLAA